MPHLGELQAGNRHDLHLGLSPDAPDEGELRETDGAFGYVHSYETASRWQRRWVSRPASARGRPTPTSR